MSITHQICSSALLSTPQVAYKMLEAQQAALAQPNPASSLPDEPRSPDVGDGDGDGDDATEASAERQNFSAGQELDDVS